MRQKLTLLLAVLILSVFAKAQTVEIKLQAIIDSIYKVNPASVGILLYVESPENGISWSGASGFSDKNKVTPLEPDQPGLIASNIKTFVSASVLSLVENKKLFIEQPIKNLLTEKTRKLFEAGGYNLDNIKIKHLLSHTSGIQDYASQAYIDFINENKKYRWTRDEQLELTVKQGPPLGDPEKTFSYSDANYLLLTEIIENITGEPFYSAMRNLLGYEQLGLNDTWMPTLENKPENTKPLVHQYWEKYNWDSYDIDVSVDLYGGGGIACTTHDLATFLYKLFHSEIIRDPKVFNLIFTEIPTKDSQASNYYFGLSSKEIHGIKAYGHGGFWATEVNYFPVLNASVAIFILSKEQSGIRNNIFRQVLEIVSSMGKGGS